jgi:prolyl-tRNA editing enzyme YbaK/EbsC (Cys-tRNA(Pro) deacylase)
MKTAIMEKLDALQITYTLKLHAKPAYTSEDAARERGVRLSQIVKTMLLTDRLGHIVITVLPGDKKLDLKRVKKLSKLRELRLMDKESIENSFGLVAGAIAPVEDLFAGLSILVDPSVFEESLVDMSSGDPCAGLEVSREDLSKLLKHADVVEIAKVV